MKNIDVDEFHRKKVVHRQSFHTSAEETCCVVCMKVVLKGGISQNKSFPVLHTIYLGV